MDSSEVAQGGEPDEQRQKFLVELEFVQCLANPLYIDWLATQVNTPPFSPSLHACEQACARLQRQRGDVVLTG